MAPSTIVPPPGTTVYWHGRGTSGWVQGAYPGLYGGYVWYPTYYSEYGFYNPYLASPFNSGPTNFEFLFP
jgi:hypothetical protein